MPTETPEFATTSTVLHDALQQLRLEGAIFFRSELTEPFAFESTPGELADLLHPGAARIILFHIVAQGSCWVAAADGDRHWAKQGDVIVLPYGDEHTIGGENPASCVAINTLLDPLPWDHMPLLRHGGGGARTELVCGYLHSEDPLFDPAMRVFPQAFVVHIPAGATSGWVRASIEYSLEETAPSNASPSLISTRLPELVLIEVLRLHLATAPAADQGGSRRCAIRCWRPRSRCCTARPNGDGRLPSSHRAQPCRARLLDERFRQVLGRSPIRYLTEWRMHLAEELLATTDIGVVALARRVGYDSEEAFSRAFKRARGLSPSHWRAARSAPSPAPEGI